MTTAADDSAVEDAFEAVLAGRPVPEGTAGLAAFTGAVRASATRPGRPNAALAELLATGLLTDQSSPSVRTARSAGSAPVRRPSRVRIRRRFAMFFTVLFAKFLSAGAVAQAASGAGVVLVAITGVGAVGALPAPVQDTFSTVVAAMTPLEPSTSEDTTGATTEEVVPEEALAEDVETTDEIPAVPELVDEAEATEAFVSAWALEGPNGSESFTAWVEKGNKDGRVKDWLRAHGMNFGNVVSAWANGKGFSDEELALLGRGLDEESGTTEADSDEAAEDVTETEETETETETEVEVEDTDDRGSRGNGNGNGGKGRDGDKD